MLNTTSSTSNLASIWGLNLDAAICEQCDWSYLLPPGSLPLTCPHCFQAEISPLEEQVDQLPHTRPPERFLPFATTPDRLAQSIERFANTIWFAPSDLKPAHLKERLQRIYLPMWLVDSDVQATWQAEAGFDYQVVSHQDQYDQNRGDWLSQEITETRIRWEPRLGQLRRTYHNIAAPALEEQADLLQKIGRYDLEAAQPYQAEEMAGAFIRLPNRSPADAWPEAAPSVQNSAAKECRRACRADHLRQFQWTAAYANRHWTLLLLPLYTTYYLDDEQNPQPVVIHGQTGRLHGPRRASMQRAQRLAIIIVIVAAVIAVLSLLAAAAALLLPPLLLVAGIGLTLAFLVGLAALAPPGIAWQFNRQNQ